MITKTREGIRRASDRLPLRIKLVATVLALVIGALVAADIAATTSLRGYLLGRIDTQLADAASRTLRGPGGPGDPGLTGNDDHVRPPSDYYIAWAGSSGNLVVLDSDPIRAGQSGPRLPRLTTSVAAERSKPFTVPAVGEGSGWRIRLTPLSNGTTLVVGTDLGDLNGTVSRLLFLELITGLVVLVLLAGLAYVLVGSSLRPLVEVEETAAAIAAGDLSRRVPSHDPRTEVGRLSSALNGMLAQIEAAFGLRQASESAAKASEERMRRFVADASHELRTPLTSIRGFAELYRQGAATDTEDVTHYMRRIEDAAARMGLLVDDLLLLARLDQQRPLERRPVDLLVLAADAVHDAQAIAPARKITLEAFGGSAPPVVTGDDSRLRQVLGNLVGNALVHTAEGTPVTVRVGSTTDNGTEVVAVLEVVDAGSGLPPEEADRVFERFYRADKSRARSRGGSGLGLSIVAALTAAHGGRVEVDTQVGRGTTFRVVLPLAQVAPTAALAAWSRGTPSGPTARDAASGPGTAG
ncbi:MAG: HAMP domain-containing histidine kinase [Actinomycetota bacterium]|nr:HAMP domain-containing histidine kinase [Actinomycetota bacterium]